MRKRNNVTNVYVTNINITEKEKKSKKIKDFVLPVAATTIVQEVVKKTLPYVQQLLFSVLSLFSPGGYVSETPQVEQYQEQTVTVTDPDYIPLQSEDGQVMFLQYTK